jgi:hypothetical protein
MVAWFEESLSRTFFWMSRCREGDFHAGRDSRNSLATSRFLPVFRDFLVCVAPNRLVAAGVVTCDDWSACAATIELAGNAQVIRTNTGTPPYFSTEITGAMRCLRPNVYSAK